MHYVFCNSQHENSKCGELSCEPAAVTHHSLRIITFNRLGSVCWICFDIQHLWLKKKKKKMSHSCWVKPDDIWNRPAPELQQLLKVRMQTYGRASLAILTSSADDISHTHPHIKKKTLTWSAPRQQCQVKNSLLLCFDFSNADAVAVRHPSADVIRGNYFSFNNQKPISGASDRSGGSQGSDVPWKISCYLRDINTKSQGAAGIAPNIKTWRSYFNSVFWGEKKYI